MKVVYLDTQDFSRFGEVIRGRADQSAKELFECLIAKSATGEARFVYSMVVLSELLQYHPDYESTTLARAEAVDLLCRGWCCVNPSGLMAREAAWMLRRESIQLPSVIRSKNDWTPNLSNVFEDFEQQLSASKKSVVDSAKHMNRKARKIAEKGATDRAFSKLLVEAAPVIAAEYGLSQQAFLSSFLLLHKKKITSEEASRRFFAAVSSPTGFVHTYFKKYEGEKDFPRWVGGAGHRIKAGFEVTVDKLKSLPIDVVARQWDGAFENVRQEVSRLILGLASAEVEPLGISEEELSSLYADERIQDIPSIRISVDIMKEYLAQAIGIRGPKAQVEQGFGGDLLHSLYIPFVDVWRSDRRFSNLARVPGSNTVICAQLNKLPELL